MQNVKHAVIVHLNASRCTLELATVVHRQYSPEVRDSGVPTQAFVDEMQQRTPTERFRRECLAEFVEDELAYFNQSLITECIDSNLAPITDDWTKTDGLWKYHAGAFGRHGVGYRPKYNRRRLLWVID